MTPRKKEESYSTQNSILSDKTKVCHTPDGAPYVVCTSDKPFLNPTSSTAPPEEIVKQLNLDLGQKLLSRKNTTLLWMIDFMDRLFFRWWEVFFFNFWSEVVPIKLRRGLTFTAWNVYLRLHKQILGKRTGMHPSQSYEYHALTTVMWWARFIAVTPRRMRFSLSQLYAITPNPPPSHELVTKISEQPVLLDRELVPTMETEACKVKGWYVHRHSKSKPTENIIFWIYGGAYLAGDVRGNSAAADWIGQRCGMDVFVPHLRLAPEANIDDVLWDTCLAYKWLCQRMSSHSSQIFVLGISSGGALATRLMQLIGESSRGEPTGVPEYFSPLLKGTPMPKGGILFGPYVDYDPEKKGSFLYYPRLDLVVTESVQQHGLPYLETFIPKRPDMENPRREYSPIHRSMQDLPPLCVVVSEHEAVYDMSIQLVNRGRREGVAVTVAVFKYMCHVFSFLLGFVPEGRLSMEVVCDWILEQSQEGSRNGS